MNVLLLAAFSFVVAAIVRDLFEEHRIPLETVAIYLAVLATYREIAG